MIRFENVTLAYKKQIILEDISFCIERGKITTLLGPNGSGKTTLMSAINGVVKPVKGKIYINSVDALNINTKERSKIIATVPQLHSFSFDFTVYDIVMLGRSPHVNYLPNKVDKNVVEETLFQVGISHLKNKNINKLSGGERQLAMIARAIAQETEIILLDEPTSYLDLKNQVKVLSLIKHINSTKKVTCIMTLHDPNQALMFSNNIVMFNKGRVETGKIDDMITKERIQDVYGIKARIVRVYDNKYVIPLEEHLIN